MTVARCGTIALGCVLLFGSACRPGDQEADVDTSKPSDFGFQLISVFSANRYQLPLAFNQP